MKRHIIQAIDDTIKLLEECGRITLPQWYAKQCNVLRVSNPNSLEFQTAIVNIRRSLGGCGSLSDQVLIPRETSLLSEDEAKAIQWRLITTIDEETEKLLHNK